MRVIRKILYAFIFLIALLCIFIGVCAVNPGMAEKIQTMLYKDADSSDTDEQPYIMTGLPIPDVSPLLQTESGSTQDDDAENVSTQPTPSANVGTQNDSGWRDRTQSDGLRSDNSRDYIAPDESDITAPSEVAGKNGYKQIQGDEQQIDDRTADDIQNQLDFGNTGDGLNFDALYYPYYAMLDDTGRHVYRQIYANANAVNDAFMPVEDVTAAQLRNIFAAVYNDHPELFWIDTAYTCKYTRAGRCVEIDLKFNRTANDLNTAKAAFNEQANSIIAAAQTIGGNYAREKYVHDQLIEKVSYSGRAEMNQSAYSALVNGQTVCAGYARAFQYIMQQLGIPCYYCTGYAGESHAWNVVSLEDGFYNVDTTWDDTDDGTYEYFNKNDEDYSGTHLRQELSVYLPPCNGVIYRNLEKDEEDDETPAELRSLEDAGLTEDKVFTDINEYYRDCYNQMVRNGIGHYTFSNAVVGQGLENAIMQNYQNGSYRDIYMQSVVDALGAAYCTWQVVPEPLEGDIYMFSYEIDITK